MNTVITQNWQMSEEVNDLGRFLSVLTTGIHAVTDRLITSLINTMYVDALVLQFAIHTTTMDAVTIFYDNTGTQVEIAFIPLTNPTPMTDASLNTAIDAVVATYATGKGYTLGNIIHTFNPLALASTQAPATRSIVTGTGAVGFQPSATRDVFGNYNVTIASAVQIGVATNVQGTMVLEIAPTNSATAGDWVEVARFTNGQNIGLALALASTQTLAGQLSGMIPAGYYAKIRSINNSGTPTYTYNSGQEVLL